MLILEDEALVRVDSSFELERMSVSSEISEVVRHPLRNSLFH